MPIRSLLLIIPPLTQLNTPYPSTAYLTGFLRSHGYSVVQADLGIEMILSVFSRRGLLRIFDVIAGREESLPGEAKQMLALRDSYLATIDAVISFLQGRDPMLAHHFARQGALPEGPRFSQAQERSAAATSMPVTDAARHRATLYLEDLMDLIRETITPHFALNRYAERIGRSYSAVHQALQRVGVKRQRAGGDPAFRAQVREVGLGRLWPGRRFHFSRSASGQVPRWPGRPPVAGTRCVGRTTRAHTHGE